MRHGETMAMLFASWIVLWSSWYWVAVCACRANCALYSGLWLTLTLGLTLGKGLDLVYPLGRVPTPWSWRQCSRAAQSWWWNARRHGTRLEVWWITHESHPNQENVGIIIHFAVNEEEEDQIVFNINFKTRSYHEARKSAIRGARDCKVSRKRMRNWVSA